MRFAARCEIEPEAHTSTIVFGAAGGIPNRDYGVRGDRAPRRRARRGRRGDPRAAPDPGGDTARSAARSTTASCRPRRASTSAPCRSTKGCYPGQEPIARQHYRGKVNRRLRVLELDGSVAEPATRRALRREGGRPRHERGARASRSPTCASRCPTTQSCASVAQARGYTDRSLAPVAQGIERCPAEAEVASSNLAGRIALLSKICPGPSAGRAWISSVYFASARPSSHTESGSRERGRTVAGPADSRAGWVFFADGFPSDGRGHMRGGSVVGATRLPGAL